jgi:hypothetical protein
MWTRSTGTKQGTTTEREKASSRSPTTLAAGSGRNSTFATNSGSTPSSASWTEGMPPGLIPPRPRHRPRRPHAGPIGSVIRRSAMRRNQLGIPYNPELPSRGTPASISWQPGHDRSSISAVSGRKVLPGHCLRKDRRVGQHPTVGLAARKDGEAPAVAGLRPVFTPLTPALQGE